MPIFRLSTREFIAALNRAAIDDQRWPNLRIREWLLAHATSRDGEVILDTRGEHAPRPAMGDLQR